MKHILIPSLDTRHGLAEMALYGVFGPVWFKTFHTLPPQHHHHYKIQELIES